MPPVHVTLRISTDFKHILEILVNLQNTEDPLASKYIRKNKGKLTHVYNKFKEISSFLCITEELLHAFKVYHAKYGPLNCI